MKYLILIILWLVFCFLHSFLIHPPVENFLKNKFFPENSYRIFYNLISIFSFAIAYLYLKINFPEPKLISIPFWLSAIFVVSGVFLTLWSFSYYDLKEFLGFTSKNTINFVRKGPLKYLRHPLYLAALLLIWSASFNLPRLLVNIILSGYIFLGIKLEERKLINIFGEEYENYKKEVPALFPLPRRIFRK
ncbi:methyltransferase family protein [Carboxydothermus pertinax]|uniref:methyltransferase family protein n=1 Tax=Carboxydothermus pertinax TaxID=870242 RepID=UPI00096A90A1|nr:NnrU family protein [Carboxydothermus pertinax]